MWISPRSALIALGTALFIVALIVLVPRMRSNLASPEPVSRTVETQAQTPIDEALAIVGHAERVRGQRMQTGSVKEAPAGTAVFEPAGLVAKGNAITPKGSDAEKLADLIRKNASSTTQTGSPKPSLVIRYAQGTDRADFLLDSENGLIVVQLNRRTLAVLDAHASISDLKTIEASILATP